MAHTTIHLLVSIDKLILMVYFCDTQEWQFRLISPGGAVFGEHKLYYSAQAAEKAGREWIERGS